MDYSKESSFFADIDNYRFRLIKKYVGKNKGRILDIGSGSGKLNVSHSSKMFSLDISQMHNFSSSLKTEGDANKIPFKDKSFDLIVLSEVLEHIDDIKSAVDETARVLKDGGTVIATVPYMEKIKTHLCIHCNKPTPENAHLHSFDEKTLTDLFAKAGLHVIKIKLFENRILFMLHFFSKFSKFPIDFIDYIDIIVGTWCSKYNKIMLVAEKRASGSVGRAHPSQG
ncbi:MAG: class I SAM-dependent methyltransferase [bacterium]